MTASQRLSQSSTDARTGAAPLAGLSAFEGDAQSFWPAYLQALGQAFSARRVLLLAKTGQSAWQAQAQWPADASDAAGDALRVLQVAEASLVRSPHLEPGPSPGAASSTDGAVGSHAIGACLPEGAVETGSRAAFVVLGSSESSTMSAGEVSAWLALAELAAAIPAHFARTRAVLTQAARSVAVPETHGERAERLYDVLQLSMRLGGETRFMRAALTLANELAVRFGCDRVALGWVKSAYVRLTAVSHVEKFDRSASASRELESAMEEAVDQDAELAWPGPADARTVIRAHDTYARTQGAGHVLSIPLRIDGVAVAVLTLERRARGFDDAEAWELRLIGEACARRLDHLQRTDRWAGARALARMQAWRDVLLGPSYTAWKLAGIALAVIALALALLPWPYRIDTPIALRSKDILFMPAPFDGYLRSAFIEVGDAVPAGAVLVELDTRELVLEEAMAYADAMRYAREAEKAQAARQLAEMQIALARQQQSTSKLELIRHQLANAQLRAPFAGVVVEGELKKNLGAAVRKGDLLVKLAHTGDTYVELEIDQVDVHEVSVGMRGRFAFVGRPDLRFPLAVERIDPASTMRDGRNVYLARARIESEFQPWWRPGMGGSARLEAGERSVIWILTHRTVRYLRQLFWI